MGGLCLAQTNTVDEVSTNEVADSRIEFLTAVGAEYLKEGEFEDAEQAYLRALDAAPDDPGVRFRLATLYVTTEQYTKAIKELERLVEEFPDNAAVRNNLAWSYVTAPGIKNTRLALKHVREGLLSSPASPSLWNTLAEVYFVIGDYERAERTSTHAIETLLGSQPDEETQQTFFQQLDKIRRARKARTLLEEIGEED
jgi:Flp pilus assembly protein TadD